MRRVIWLPILALALPTAALASDVDFLFVTNFGNGTVGQYTTSGATVNANLISGVPRITGIAVSGSDLFVTSPCGGCPRGGDSVREYTTSGATVNANLIPHDFLGHPYGIAVSGSDLFVANRVNGTVGKYTTSGATVNADLISGLSSPIGIAVSGSDLFVANSSNDTIACEGKAFPYRSAIGLTLGIFAPRLRCFFDVSNPLAE